MNVTVPTYRDEVSIFAHRSDDFADPRFVVDVTVTIAADSVGEAIEAVVSALRDIGVA